MAEESSSSHGNLKRPFVEEDNESSKRARFSKGKKTKKQGDHVVIGLLAAAAGIRREIPPELIDEVTFGFLPDVTKAEVRYDNNEEGVALMEPFNLDKEREDGYFDQNGNYIEHEMINKDAWLDSVDVCEEAGTSNVDPMSIDENNPEELAEIKRRIAEVLEPGETVLQGLRRLKGSDKKQKMCGEKKRMFDQLTEDATKLMESGDYNVYDEKQESFAVAITRKDDMFGDEGESLSSVCESDYVFDESCGYYYSSSLGTYYDPSSGLYWCATSGEWYS